MNTTLTVKIPSIPNMVNVTITNRTADMESFIAKMNSELKPHFDKLFVGLGVQWNKSDPDTKAATLQLCSNEICIIIQLLHLESPPQCLKDFLADPRFNFVGAGITNNVEKLARDHGLVCNKFDELGTLAARFYSKPEWEGMDILQLAQRCIGIIIKRTNEAASRKDWSSMALTMEQIEIATVDAYVPPLAYWSMHFLMGMDET